MYGVSASPSATHFVFLSMRIRPFFS
jgi:hypothetical protein